MNEKLTITQRQRLMELNVEEEFLNIEFLNKESRDHYFKEKELEYVKKNRVHLSNLLKRKHKPLLIEVQDKLIDWLIKEESFTQVVTPIIITDTMLSKMTITKEHPLTNQVFWVDNKKCLRPMLAPNLYEVMRDILKTTKEPVKIFEVGSCFRKESQGSKHLNEFTMLNLVELAGVKDGQQMERLKSLANKSMEKLGIQNYHLEVTTSEVYKETLDIVIDGVEIASGAYGPHALDDKWGIFDTWVGIGFGVERLAMVLGGYNNIKKVGKSLSYLDGVRLNL